jgi:hypothetical protein
VVAVSYVVADSFQETMTTTMTASDLKKVIVVMLLYGAMWGLGLLGISMCSVHHAKHRRDVSLGRSDIVVKKELASLTRSREDIRQYLTAYGECCSRFTVLRLLTFDVCSCGSVAKCVSGQGWFDSILGRSEQESSVLVVVHSVRRRWRQEANVDWSAFADRPVDVDVHSGCVL